MWNRLRYFFFSFFCFLFVIAVCLYYLTISNYLIGMAVTRGFLLCTYFLLYRLACLQLNARLRKVNLICIYISVMARSVISISGYTLLISVIEFSQKFLLRPSGYRNFGGVVSSLSPKLLQVNYTTINLKNYSIFAYNILTYVCV